MMMRCLMNSLALLGTLSEQLPRSVRDVKFRNKKTFGKGKHKKGLFLLFTLRNSLNFIINAHFISPRILSRGKGFPNTI